MSNIKLPSNLRKFTKTDKSGNTIKLRWDKLPEHRLEEFVDFYMKYYVPYEMTHTAAGIYKRAEAMEEYKQILINEFKDPKYILVICCVDNDNGDILVAEAMRLCRKGEIRTNIEAQTAEVKRYLEIVNDLEMLFSVQKIMAKYDVESYFDDEGIAIHPEFKGLGISKELCILRINVCKENNVPLAGGWATSLAMQKTSFNLNFEPLFKIGYEDVQKILRSESHTVPPEIILFIKKIRI